MDEWIKTVQAGTSVEVRTARGEWLAVPADSSVEGTHRDGRRIHNFPVVWVVVDGHRIPWPVTDVRKPVH
jgi:hypothetical protein